MRIRRESSPPPFLNRRAQRRLIMMGGLLVLVLVGMKMAAKPETWNWLFAGRQPAQNGSQQNADISAKDKTVPLQPGEFRAGDGKTEAISAPRPNNAAILQTGASSDAESFNPELDRALFANIKDRDSLNFDELDAYYAILAKVAKAPQRALRRAGGEEAPFTVLLNDPDSQRGKILTLNGKLGRLRRLPGKRENLGLPKLYDAWIITPASDNNPYRVVISELPEGLEPSERFEPAPEVRVTGYFFKVQRYTADDSRPHYTPLLLAKSLHVVTPEERASPGLGVAPYVMGFAILVGATLALFMWRFSRGDKEFAAKNLKQYAATAAADPAGLQNVQLTEDAAAFFQRITEEENGSAETIREPPE